MLTKYLMDNGGQTFTHRIPLQFSALLRHDLVKDLVCYYEEDKRQMKYVIQLGRCVAPYSRLLMDGDAVAEAFIQVVVRSLQRSKIGRGIAVMFVATPG